MRAGFVGTIGLALALVMGVVLGSCQLAGPPKAQALQGRILWPKDGDLWVYDLASKQQTKITNLPQGAAVTGATWSPDGKRVVFAQFWRRPNERSSGADLFVANADGSNARPFAERDAANTVVVETPEWAASGRVYYTDPAGQQRPGGAVDRAPGRRRPARKSWSTTATARRCRPMKRRWSTSGAVGRARRCSERRSTKVGTAAS